MRLILAYSILLLVTLVGLGGYSVIGEFRYSKLLLFDLDGDGSPEVVTDAGILSNGALQAFPRPLDIYRFNCYPNIQCLLLVDRGVGLGYIYAPGRFVAELPLDGVISISHSPYGVLIVGSKAYWGGLWVKASLNPIGLKAFIYDGRLTLAYIDNDTRYLILESQGLPRRILPLEGNLLGVGSTGNLVHFLVGSDTGTTFIEWSPQGLLMVKVYNVIVYDVVAYHNGTFIANGVDGVYMVRGDLARLILEGYKVVKIGVNGELLLVGLGKVVVAEVYEDGLRIVSEHTLGGVVDVDYGYGILAYTDGLKVNTVTLTPRVGVELSIPSNVIAGELVEVTVLGDFISAHVKLPDVGVVRLDKSNPRFTWRPMTPGVHVVTAIVDTGGSKIVLSREVTVAPRPASLTIRVDRLDVKPYSTVTVMLEVRDGLRGLTLRDILGNCSITTPSGTYPARPWTPVVIPTTPVGLEIPISAYCRLPSPYAEATATLTLRVNESYVEVQPLYMGGGVVRFNAYNRYTGEPVDGELRVMIGANTTVIKIGGEVKLPRPGLWEVRWELIANNVVLARGSHLVTWYGDITQAPPGAPVVVADRFITVTEPRVEFKETPVMVTVEVSRIDPLTALLAFMAGLALAGTPLVVMLIRRGGE